jgi:hypothetical protein
MDLKSFLTDVELSTANEPSEIGKVFDDLASFMRDFSNLVMVSRLNSLTEAEQDSLKSAFVAKWYQFIQEMNQLKENMTFDTTFNKVISSLGDWEYEAPPYMPFQCCARYVSSAWGNYTVFANGFDSDDLEALIDAPGDPMNYLIWKDTTGSEGSEYLVLEFGAANVQVSSFSEITEAALTGSQAYAIFRGLVNLSDSAEDVPVSIDLLEERFPMMSNMVSLFDTIISALALS